MQLTQQQDKLRQNTNTIFKETAQPSMVRRYVRIVRSYTVATVPNTRAAEPFARASAVCQILHHTLDTLVHIKLA